MKFSKTTWQPDLTQIHAYIDDLQRVMLLRDKSPTKDERERFDTVIECMQLVLEFLNTPPESKA